MSPRSSTVVFDASKIEEAIEKAAQAVSANISYPEIPEDLFEVFAYLPELFQDGDEERYIEALSLAMQTSYENGLSLIHILHAVSHALYDCDLFCPSEIICPTSR